MIVHRSLWGWSHFTLKLGHPNITLPSDWLFPGKTWRGERYEWFLKSCKLDPIRIRLLEWISGSEHDPIPEISVGIGSGNRIDLTDCQPCRYPHGQERLRVNRNPQALSMKGQDRGRKEGREGRRKERKKGRLRWRRTRKGRRLLWFRQERIEKRESDR